MNGTLCWQEFIGVIDEVAVAWVRLPFVYQKIQMAFEIRL
jgi:hypothetical protein